VFVRCRYEVVFFDRWVGLHAKGSVCVYRVAVCVCVQGVSMRTCSLIGVSEVQLSTFLCFGCQYEKVYLDKCFWFHSMPLVFIGCRYVFIGCQYVYVFRVSV